MLKKQRMENWSSSKKGKPQETRIGQVGTTRVSGRTESVQCVGFLEVQRGSGSAASQRVRSLNPHPLHWTLGSEPTGAPEKSPTFLQHYLQFQNQEKQHKYTVNEHYL